MPTVITNPPITAPLPRYAVPTLPIRRFSVDEYHRMIDTGILTEDDPVELLEGWIVPKMPHNPPHVGSVQRVSKRLGRRLPAGWDLRMQVPVTIGDSEPEPDGSVVRGDETTYDYRHPGPNDIGALIEIADSTLGRDRSEKGRVYARAGIPYYWIINLVDRWIEVYTEPDSTATPPVYRTRTDYRPGEQVPLVLDGKTVATIPVAELLP
jgi:Uma2 family endonuclease